MELKSVVLFIPKNNILVAAPLSKLPVNFLFGDYQKLTSYLLISCTNTPSWSIGAAFFGLSEDFIGVYWLYGPLLDELR